MLVSKWYNCAWHVDWKHYQKLVNCVVEYEKIYIMSISIIWITCSFEQNINAKIYLLNIHTIPSSINLMNDVLSISIWFPLRSNSWIMKWKKLDFLRLEGGCLVKSILARLHLERKSNNDIHFWNYTRCILLCKYIFWKCQIEN